MHVSGEWEMPEAWTAGKTELFAALRNGEALDFEEITGSFPSAEWKARIAYAQSFHFTDYILRRFGKKEVVSLLHRLAGGENFEKAFEAATGEDFYDTERYWREKVAGRGGLALLLVGVQQFDTWLWSFMSLLVIVAFVRYLFKRRKGGSGSGGGGGRYGYFDDEWDDPPDILDEWDDDSMGNRPWRPKPEE